MKSNAHKPSGNVLRSLIVVLIYMVFFVNRTIGSPPPIIPQTITTNHSNQLIIDSPELPAQGTLALPPGTIRYRPVKLNTSWFSSPSGTLQLNIFSNATYTATIDKQMHIGANVVYRFHTADDINTTGFISYVNGVASGIIPTTNGEYYCLSYAGNGSHYIVQRNPPESSVCGNTLSGPGFGLRSQSNPSTPSERAEKFADLELPTFYAPTTPTVDIMVLYTTNAMNYAGGANAILSFVTLYIAQVNTAYEQCEINANMNLVYCGLLAFAESTNNSYFDIDAYSSLTSVQALRTQVGADLVDLIALDYDTGGIAYEYDYAYNDGGVYSLCNYPNTYTGYAFAHETGHNLGCDHDYANRDGGGAFSYSYGWYWTNTTVYGSIMSYPGTRTLYYSSPTALDSGSATGITNVADNALTINNTASFVAANYIPTVLTAAWEDFTNSFFHFTLSGTNGAVYDIQSSSDLSTWSYLGTYTLSGSGSTGTAAVEDSTAIAPAWRFYRAVQTGTSTVISANSVGYTAILIPQNWSMFGNSLNCGTNTVGNLFAGFPNGSIVYKWDDSSQTYLTSRMLSGTWNNPNMTLNPGEGVLLNSPSLFWFAFVGEVIEGDQSDSLPGDYSTPLYSIRTSQLPLSGGLNSSLGYPTPPDNGDQVSLMTSTNGTYTTYTYYTSTNAWSPSQPSISVGQAFWSYVYTPFDWNVQYYIWH